MLYSACSFVLSKTKQGKNQECSAKKEVLERTRRTSHLYVLVLWKLLIFQIRFCSQPVNVSFKPAITCSLVWKIVKASRYKGEVEMCLRLLLNER